MKKEIVFAGIIFFVILSIVLFFWYKDSFYKINTLKKLSNIIMVDLENNNVKIEKLNWKININEYGRNTIILMKVFVDKEYAEKDSYFSNRREMMSPLGLEYLKECGYNLDEYDGAEYLAHDIDEPFYIINAQLAEYTSIYVKKEQINEGKIEYLIHAYIPEKYHVNEEKILGR